MIIAYIAWPPDNDTYMWADPKTRGNPPAGVICETCGQRIDYTAINPNYKPPRSYYDLSRPYDGDFLVSPRLRDYLVGQNLPGLRFCPLARSNRYLILQPQNMLRIARGPSLRFEEYCSACRQYRSVYGIDGEKLHFLDISEPIRFGIFITDLRGGYYPQMDHLLIVGTETWNGMLREKFRGMGNGKPIIN